MPDFNIRRRIIEKKIYFKMLYALIWSTVSTLVNNVFCFSNISLDSDGITSHKCRHARCYVRLFAKIDQVLDAIDGFVFVCCVWLYTISKTDHITECPNRKEIVQ
jgi:hypothetical protein